MHGKYGGVLLQHMTILQEMGHDDSIHFNTIEMNL